MNTRYVKPIVPLLVVVLLISTALPVYAQSSAIESLLAQLRYLQGQLNDLIQPPTAAVSSTTGSTSLSTLKASPTTATGGQSIIVSITNASPTTAKDWVGLYNATVPATSYDNC